VTKDPQEEQIEMIRGSAYAATHLQLDLVPVLKGLLKRIQELEKRVTKLEKYAPKDLEYPPGRRRPRLRKKE